MKDSTNPYSTDPARHPAIVVNSGTPFNGETPLSLLTDRDGPDINHISLLIVPIRARETEPMLKVGGLVWNAQ